jgi:hypothetical protein
MGDINADPEFKEPDYVLDKSTYYFLGMPTEEIPWLSTAPCRYRLHKPLRNSWFIPGAGWRDMEESIQRSGRLAAHASPYS